MLRVPLELPPPGSAADASSASIELGDEVARYVARVHRLEVGDTFVAFDPIARAEADATITSIARDRVRVDLGPRRASTRLPLRRVTLLQGLAKAEKMDAIVRDATELGATAIVPVRLARSIPSSKSDAAVTRWKRIAVEAARQCGRGDVPDVSAPVDLARALDREEAGEVRCALAPGGERSLGAIVTAANARASIALLVGPEGGLDPAEVELAAARGFTLARLGAFVLRTETAATAALGVVADAT